MPTTEPPQKLPASTAITLGWLAQHVPVAWLYVIGVALLGIVSGAGAIGYHLGTVNAVADGSFQLRQVNEDRSRVLADIQELEIKKANLDASLMRSEVEAHSKSLTKDQVIEELRRSRAIQD